MLHLTLTITWPLEVLGEKWVSSVAAQVHGVVRLSLDRKVVVGFFKLDSSIIDKLRSDSHVDFIQ